MSLGHGSSVVRDGLVLHYDMSNVQKSWKGKPTTNLFSNPTNLASGWTTNNTSYNSSTQKAYITSNSAGNYFLQDRSLTSGLEYTISLEAKAIESYIIQLTPSTGFTIADYANINLIDGSISGTATGISKANSFYLGKGWWRVSYTETATSTGSGRIAFAIGDDENYTRLSSASGLSVNDGLFIRAAQFEQNSFATPFVNGTRSNTQALIDLTGNQTITANSLVYNSDGTFEFNGSSDYITPGFTLNGNSQFTVSCWFNLDTVTKNWQSIVDAFKDVTDRNFQLWVNSDSKLYIFHLGSSHTGDSLLSINTWYNAAFSYTGSGNGVLYLNGSVLNGSIPKGAGSGGNINVNIGRRSDGNASSYTDGNISQVKIYNRALSADEVKQNFEATRGRYGI